MFDSQKVEQLSNELLTLADQLDAWADESWFGNLSTHQVEPMRQKAAEIRAKVVQITGARVKSVLY